MKKYLLQVVFLLTVSFISAQSLRVDSLLKILDSDISDSARVAICKKIGYKYQEINQTKAIEYFEKGAELARKINNRLEMANLFFSIGYSYRVKADYAKSIESYLQSVRIYEDLKDSFRLSNALMAIAGVYVYTGDLPKQTEYLDKSESVVLAMDDSLQICNLYMLRGTLNDQSGSYDTAVIYFKSAIVVALAIKDTGSLLSGYLNLGLTYKHIHREVEALHYFDSASILLNSQDPDKYALAILFNNIGATYSQRGNYAEALSAFHKSIVYAQEVGEQNFIMENYKNMADLFGDKGDFKNQVLYLEKYHAMKDSMHSVDNIRKVAQLETDYVIGKKDLEIAKNEAELQKQTNQRIIYLGLLAAGVVVAILLAFFYRRIKTKNALLETKNSLISNQKDDLENTLKNLKSTQAQLIQSEKMASLGELTAGIAHEIQNPLNFVNNFSDVNIELADELEQEIDNGNYEDAKAIAKDIKDNEEKINHHGKRADAIVKGMLQHSRSSTGIKEPTDINALADEYLRLSYHGLRAKDKSFNATMKTDFDETIGKINIVPQEIGRVILNLINNAFYAAPLPPPEKNGINSGGFPDPNYLHNPTVWVSTKKMGDQVLISVKDNGPGIPPKILDKIFQPFFTTKPTGQGTGLGLSLSYDIVKAHGGELRVETKEGEGSEFIIQLPVV